MAQLLWVYQGSSQDLLPLSVSPSCVSAPSKLVNSITPAWLIPHSAFSSPWSWGDTSHLAFPCQSQFLVQTALSSSRSSLVPWFIRSSDMDHCSWLAVVVKVHFGIFSVICMLKAFSLKSHLTSCSTSLLGLSVLKKENYNRRCYTNS